MERVGNDRDEAVTRFHIAWIDCTGDNADVTIWDPIEHRIEVFHEDTGIDPGVVSRSGGGQHLDIIEAATELLRMAGYIVHGVEPHAHGYAAIVEKSPG
jgi:hypothetical protein